MISAETPTPCASMPTLFDPDRAATDHHVKLLRDLCHGCPVQAQCFVVATTTPVKRLGGFMAGLTEPQRTKAFNFAQNQRVA